MSGKRPMAGSPSGSGGRSPAPAPSNGGALDPGRNDLPPPGLGGKPVADKIQKAAGPWARAGHDHVCEDRFSPGPYPAQPLLAKDEIDSFDPLENLGARLPRTCRESTA